MNMLRMSPLHSLHSAFSASFVYTDQFPGTHWNADLGSCKGCLKNFKAQFQTKKDLI